MFYGTSIPASILVLQKCRVHDDDILFIDASQHFEKVGNKNTLKDLHVESIIDAYHNRQTIDKFAYVASLDEIKENEYNLNIPRYVDTFEEEKPVDLKAVSQELRSMDLKMQEIDETISSFCDELGIESPF